MDPNRHIRQINLGICMRIRQHKFLWLMELILSIITPCKPAFSGTKQSSLRDQDQGQDVAHVHTGKAIGTHWRRGINATSNRKAWEEDGSNAHKFPTSQRFKTSKHYKHRRHMWGEGNMVLYVGERLLRRSNLGPCQGFQLALPTGNMLLYVAGS